MAETMNARSGAEGPIINSLKTVTEWVGAGVGAVLAWAAVAPQVGFVGEAVAAIIGGVAGKAVTSSVIR